MTERINDPTERPTVLLAHGIQHVGTRGDRSVQNCDWFVDHKQSPAGRPTDAVGAKAIPAFVCSDHPEPRIPHRKLRHDVITFANDVEDPCPEGCLVEVDRSTCSFHPQFRLDTRQDSSSDFAPARCVADHAPVAGGSGTSKTGLRRFRSATQTGLSVSTTLRVTHKAIGAEARRGTYDVFVDGNQVGSVEMNNTTEIQVAPGRHTLQIRDGRKSSGIETFDAAEDEIVTFRCTGKRFLPIFLASFIVPKLALKLVRQ